MNSKLWFHKALTMCLLVAVTATCSMVALAGDGRATGEIVVECVAVDHGHGFLL